MIRDRHHVHMNGTRWTTLTQFVYSLARAGKVKLEETEKGIFLTVIDQEKLTRQVSRAFFFLSELSCFTGGERAPCARGGGLRGKDSRDPC